MTTAEQIAQVKHSLVTNKTRLNDLRTERAHLALGKGGVTKIAKLDTQIDNLRIDIENAPATIAVLEEQLKEEQAVATQKERDKLLNQQKSVACDIEKRSKEFVELLRQAVEINEQLLPALQAYNALHQKTGQDVIGPACQGSRGWLKALYEICQAEMEGQPRPNNLPPMLI